MIWAPQGCVDGGVDCRYTLAPDVAAPFISLTNGAFEKACAALVHLHNGLGDLEEQADSVMLARGGLPERLKSKLAFKTEQCAI
jgi:hypothetical protein